jgi:AraC family transcriptional regulator, carnitine catabolism transcriptional activator
VKADYIGELPRSIGFLVLPGFSMLALFGAIEPLRLANQLLDERHYNWRVFTRDGAPARASCGMTVPADDEAGRSAGPHEPSCLIVIAGFDPWPQPDQRLKAWLRGLDRRGATLGAVDTGAFLLAAADLLGSAPAVVHWESAGAFIEMFPDVELSARPYEIAGRRMLCAGGTAVLDMMISLIERNHGPILAAGVKRRLVFPGSREETEGQRSPGNDRLPARDPDVLCALHVMEEHVETVLSIAKVASTVRVSKRTLERKFRQVLGQTPSQVYLQYRLEHARRLLRHSDLRVSEIALASGFSSLSYFCRAYKLRFRVRPASDRRLNYSLVQPGATLGRASAVASPGDVPLNRRDNSLTQSGNNL